MFRLQAMRFLRSCLVILSLTTAIAIPCSAAKPKFPPDTQRLVKNPGHIRRALAPDYWALSPYYEGQDSVAGASVATTSMVLNAIRANRDLRSDDELVTQRGLLARVKSPAWHIAVSAGRNEVPLELMKPVLEEALRAYAIQGYTIELFQPEENLEKFKQAFHRALVENEKSADDFLIVSFIQGILTGSEHVGQIAPIAAFDAQKKRVLIFDPDRQWYEPYWALEAQLVQAMVQKPADPNSKTRGFIWLRKKK
ncbi:MAG: phytochelatin synthase family protein [Bdellovibrionota bacterium]